MPAPNRRTEQAGGHENPIRARVPTGSNPVRDLARKEQPVSVTAPDLSADRLWTPEDVSAFIGVPVATLYQWRHKGKGPKSFRVGKHLRYKPTDVSTWLDEQG
jgi:predicted DNA-binding transcriptional regulator AlpA